MGNIADALYRFLQANRGLPFRAMSVFNYLLEAALAGGVLILLMLLVRRFLRGRLGNRAIYVAWLLVAVRLLTPLAIPNPLMNELRPTWSQDAAARPVADQVRVRFNDALNDFAYELSAAQYRAAQEQGMSRQEYNRSLEGDTFPEVLQQFGYANSYGWTGKWFLLAYGAAAVGVAGWMIAVNAAFRRRLRRSRAGELSPSMQETYLALCSRVGVKPLPVQLVDPLPGACLTGVFRPVICLPLTMREEDIPYALQHELCHYKARDNWWSMLRLICCAVQWFNPLVWIAAKCVRTDCELACDDRVTASMGEEDRRAYAEVLLTSAARRSAPGLAVVATGMTMNGRRLKQRIAAILENRVVRRWAATAFLCAACVVAAMAVCTEESDPMSQRRPGYDNDLNDMPLATDWYAPSDLAAGSWNSLSAQAAAYMNHSLLGGRGYYSVSIVEDDAGVSASVSGSGNYYGDVSLLRLDKNGQLISYRAKNAGGDWVQNDRTTPPNTDEAVLSYVQALSDAFFGGAEVSGYDPAFACAVNKGERNGYQFHASIGGAAYRFILDMDWMVFDRIERLDVPSGGMVRDQLDAVQAMWDALSALGVSDPGHAMTFVQWRKADQSWLVTMYADNTSPDEYHTALAARFGEQPRYTLEMIVPAFGGEAGEITLKPLTFTLAEEIPGNAPTSVTMVYTETYNLIAGEKLMRDDTLPVGVPYTIVAQGNEAKALMGGAYQEYPGFVLIRYESPLYGTTVDRWTQDPEAWRLRDVGVEATPIPDAHRETLTCDGITIPAVNKVNDPNFSGFAAAPETALSAEEALAVAVRAVEAHYGLPAENLLVYQLSYGYRPDAPDFTAPYWQFDFYINDYDFFEVIFHDPDGEVLYISGPSEGNG